MKKLICLLAVILPLWAAAGPKIDLSGRWQFKIDSTDVGVSKNWQKNPHFAEEVKLPGSMTTNGKGNEITLDTKWTSWVADSAWFRKPMFEKYRQPGNVKVIFWLQPEKEYVGPAWYSREFTVTEEMKGRELILNMEQVHWESMVWVDGKPLGMQNSLSTAHRYNLGMLKPGKHNVCVRVDNRIKDINVGINAHSVADHTQTNWNGIAGDMFIEARPQVYITNVSVYPDNDRKQAKVVVTFNNTSESGTEGEIKLFAESKFTPYLHKAEPVKRQISVPKGKHSVELIYPMGDKFFTWDEHNPYFYQLNAAFGSGAAADEFTTTFGMRKISTIGRQFAINDKPIFLRGTLDCAIFPKTGYPSTDVAEWRRIFSVIKSHGLNHARYHSWCPPEAAFEAADQMGVYLQVEGASWTFVIGDGTPFDKYIYDETDRILERYGNHPSFILYTYGNEPGGEKMNEFLNDFVGHYKKFDPRRMYTSGAGWPPNPNDDFNNDMYPRICPWFSGLSSHINKYSPSTSYDWYEIIDTYKIPYISHEAGNWCVYPNFKEIDKYDGAAVRAKNFEVFREMLEENGLAELGETYLQASGKLQTICYKAEVEAALRTKDFAGIQLLSLQDFPGQGTALVGVLDAFWEEKGYTAPEEYKRFAGETVPLARMKKLIYSNSENLEADIEIAHFGEHPLKGVIPSWTLSKSTGEIVAHGNLSSCDIPIGNCIPLGKISYSLDKIAEPVKMKLAVSVAGKTNDWEIWVYPAIEHKIAANIRVSDTLDAATVKFMENGGNVLFTPKMGSIKEGKGGEITLGFSTIFWNTGWTVHQQPPYAFGVLVDPASPAMKYFPTDFHSNYQWWDAMMNGNAVKLDELDKNLQPLVRIIDDWFQNYSLGLVSEAKVGKGKIIICGVDLLTNQQNRLEAKQLQYSLTQYMASPEFNPAVTLTADKIKTIIK